jgi:hypothetical protein
MARILLWLLTGLLLAASWAWAFYGNQAAAGECFGVAALCAGVAMMGE